MTSLEQVELLMEGAAGAGLNGEMNLEAIERVARRKTVLRALAVDRWNISHAAKRLGVHRNTMTRIMRECDIRRPR